MVPVGTNQSKGIGQNQEPSTPLSYASSSSWGLFFYQCATEGFHSRMSPLYTFIFMNGKGVLCGSSEYMIE
jgi:hypothetical protein